MALSSVLAHVVFDVVVDVSSSGGCVSTVLMLVSTLVVGAEAAVLPPAMGPGTRSGARREAVYVRA